jgi:acyl-CoA thioesterase
MDPKVKKGIIEAVKTEPFARALKIELIDLALGYSQVEMEYNPDSMDNIYQRAHGGAIFGLIDEAFETACQTHGTIAVALNVNVTYVASPLSPVRLRAEAREVSRTKRTASYDIKVTTADGEQLIATCQALAYRTGKAIPWIEK